jgi:hypothetical protein
MEIQVYHFTFMTAIYINHQLFWSGPMGAETMMDLSMIPNAVVKDTIYLSQKAPEMFPPQEELLQNWIS